MPGPPTPAFDEQLMRRAIRLAMNGRGRVEPNPMVGCVIVKDGRVIGEGWHERFGGPHAEPNALAACTESPEGATAYVTLEPCCHTNKKTPPCVPALVRARVRRVVVGCLDPNQNVNGQGVARLRAAGIDVNIPATEGPANQLIAAFLLRTRGDRPYVTVKWAQTADGKVAGPGGRRIQISNAVATQLVHELRGKSDAVVVGMGTVREDDPELTARGVAFARPSIRAVIGGVELGVGGRLLETVTAGTVVLYYGPSAVRAENPSHQPLLDEAVKKLRALGVQPAHVKEERPGRISLAEVLGDLGGRGTTHALIETGPTLGASLFEAGLVDRVWVLRSPKSLHELTTYVPVRYRGKDAPIALTVPAAYLETGTLDLAGDTLTEYLNPASGVFFAAEPSADFVLARESAGA